MYLISLLDENTSSFFDHRDPNRVEWFGKLIKQKRNMK